MALDVVKRCGVSGCQRPVWARGLCDSHLSRLRRHGHLEATRPADWGARRAHALYPYWKQIRRNGLPVCELWHDDFWAFVEGVGDRPSALHSLYRPDQTKAAGPGNAAWATSKAGPARDESHAAFRDKHGKYMREWQRQRRVADPFFDFRGGLKKAHGITLEAYEAMLDAQGAVCAICGRDEPRHATSSARRFRLAVDHCHGSAEIRGLLCSMCNHAIGYLDDSPALLQRAIDYLRDPPAARLRLPHNGKHRVRRREREPSPYVGSPAAGIPPAAIPAPASSGISLAKGP